MNPKDDIVLWPHKVLRSECDPIETIDDDIRCLARGMLECMYEANGCGLAAPQVGRALQMIVIDVDYGEGRGKNPYVLINPTIIEADGEMSETYEGCLSFPGISVVVSRPSHVIVHALNLDGQLMRYEAADNLMCVCLQHEIDHVHGITMIDHLTLQERSEALASYREALAAGARPGDVSHPND